MHIDHTHFHTRLSIRKCLQMIQSYLTVILNDPKLRIFPPKLTPDVSVSVQTEMKPSGLKSVFRIQVTLGTRLATFLFKLAPNCNDQGVRCLKQVQMLDNPHRGEKCIV